jgi:hypothetical protein
VRSREYITTVASIAVMQTTVPDPIAFVMCQQVCLPSLHSQRAIPTFARRVIGPGLTSMQVRRSCLAHSCVTCLKSSSNISASSHYPWLLSLHNDQRFTLVYAWPSAADSASCRYPPLLARQLQQSSLLSTLRLQTQSACVNTEQLRRRPKPLSYVRLSATTALRRTLTLKAR